MKPSRKRKPRVQHFKERRLAMKKSIRKRLTIAFIGLAVGPLLLVGAIFAWQSFRILQHQALNHQQEISRRVSNQVAAFFKEIERELRVVGQVQGLGKLDRNQQNRTLSGLLSFHNVFDELVLLDNKGGNGYTWRAPVSSPAWASAPMRTSSSSPWQAAWPTTAPFNSTR